MWRFVRRINETYVNKAGGKETQLQRQLPAECQNMDEILLPLKAVVLDKRK